MEDVKKSHNEQDLERVADTSKTIDHIADVNKKVSLTEQWKKGKLEEYKKYYCKTKWFEDIFQARCYNKDAQDEWWVLKNEKYNYNNVYHPKDIEVLAPVPSYKEWQQMKAFCEEFNALNVAKENQKLKELLSKAKGMLSVYRISKNQSTYSDKEVLNLLTQIDEVLNADTPGE